MSVAKERRAQFWRRRNTGRFSGMEQAKPWRFIAIIMIITMTIPITDLRQTRKPPRMFPYDQMHRGDGCRVLAAMFQYANTGTDLCKAAYHD